MIYYTINNLTFNHAIIQLIDQLVKSFNDNKFTIGVFIDLSKAFDTVDRPSHSLRKTKTLWHYRK